MHCHGLLGYLGVCGVGDGVEWYPVEWREWGTALHCVEGCMLVTAPGDIGAPLGMFSV